jgi:hypothetical protein
MRGPPVRQMARVPDRHLVFVDSALNRRGRGVVLVNDGVQYGLSKGLVGDWERFYSNIFPVENSRPQVLRSKKVECLDRLGEEVVFDEVLVKNIGFVIKESDLDVRTGEEPLGVGMKEEQGSPNKILSLHEPKPLKKLRTGCPEICWIDPFGLARETAEYVEGASRELLEAYVRDWDAIPCAPVLAEWEPVEGGSFQLLLRAAASYVILPFVANRVGVRLNVNLNQIFAILVYESDIGQDAQYVANVVR